MWQDFLLVWPLAMSETRVYAVTAKGNKTVEAWSSVLRSNT